MNFKVEPGDLDETRSCSTCFPCPIKMEWYGIRWTRRNERICVIVLSVVDCLHKFVNFYQEQSISDQYLTRLSFLIITLILISTLYIYQHLVCVLSSHEGLCLWQEYYICFLNIYILYLMSKSVLDVDLFDSFLYICQ
jgi:hypothetical protein